MKWVIAFIGVTVVFVLGFYSGKMSNTPESRSVNVAAVSETSEEETTPTDISTYEWYPVVKVVDGDTLAIAIEGKNVTLRLIGLDTPETVDPRKLVQCFGREASEKAKQLLSGSSVRLEYDFSQGSPSFANATEGTVDKYGRTLAYVYVVANSKPEGILVNEYMIREGYGHEYTYNLPYKYQAQFKEAERLAREEKKGLWADRACEDAAEAVTKPSVSAPAAGNYECSRNAYNCSSFSSQTQAQSAFESCGGSGNDVHKLDADGDGRVCESLP